MSQLNESNESIKIFASSDEVTTTVSGVRRIDDSECIRRFTLEMAFKLLTSGRPELIAQAMQILPLATRINTINESCGMTALMLACANGDEGAVRALLDAGADVNVETPAATAGSSPVKGSPHRGHLNASSNSLTGHNASNNNNNISSQQFSYHSEFQHWTALTYTALLGHCGIARLLLERGASVEGGAKPSEDKVTITPLQAAAASGSSEMVALLLGHGAQPFLSTLIKDTFCYSGSAQRGSYR